MSHCHDEHDDSHGHDGHDHEHADGHTHDDDIIPAVQSSLYQHIDFDAITTLNESTPDSGKLVVKKTWDERFNDTPELESDSDQEILMMVPFTGQTKLHSLLIRSPPDITAPLTLHLFSNRNDIDFSTASDLTPTQILTLPQLPASSSLDIIEIPLKRASFNNVQCLTLFFKENHSDGEEEVTKISYLGFKGDFTKLNKEPIDFLYEAAANPKDHTNLVPGGQDQMASRFES